MRSWMKLLPWFLVVWFARTYCEQFTIDGKQYARPFWRGPLLSKADHPPR